MRERGVTYSNRSVGLPNASVAFDSNGTAKRGAWFEYRERYEGGTEGRRLARMIGTVDATGEDGLPPVRNWIVALAVSDRGSFAYLRWIDPRDVTWSTREPPGAMLAWIAQPTATLPSLKACLRLDAYGSLSQRFVREVGLRLRDWGIR
jgi:hypothetical protein